MHREAHSTRLVFVALLSLIALVAAVAANARSHAVLTFPSAQGWASATVSTTYNDWDFGQCDGAYTATQAHLGTDSQGSAAGQPVYAMSDGTVSQKASGWPGAALGIAEQTADGTQFLAVYGHINTSLNAGNTVARGQQIGTIYDQAGNSHLHLGVRPIAAGESPSTVPLIGESSCPPNTNGYVNPIPWLQSHLASAYFINKIVKWTDGTAWLVGPDLRRRWIKDGRAYNCLRGNGIPDTGAQSSSVLDRLPDLTGVRAHCPAADINESGVVDITDLSIMLSYYGTTANLNADLTYDGRVDIFDLSKLLSTYGATH